MKEMEQALLHALNDLELAAAAGIPGSHRPNVAEILRRIDSCSERLPQPIDPQLAHFLARKSYQKARDRLQELAAVARSEPTAQP